MFFIMFFNFSSDSVVSRENSFIIKFAIETQLYWLLLSSRLNYLNAFLPVGLLIILINVLSI